MSEDERLFLVVDPDARTHRVLESALTDCGGRVMVRESADQALEVLCSEPVDLVIASTTLADGDGFRLCSMMRGEADFDAIPLIFISDDSSKSRRLEGLQAGAADYLSEPFFFAELQMRIEALLARNVQLDSDVAWTVTEGSLADRSLVDLLTEVEQKERTGTLSVARDGRQAVVHFEGGKITGAVSGTLEDKGALLGLVAWPAGEFVLRILDRADGVAPEPDEVVLVGMRPLEAWSEVVDGLPELRRVFERDAEKIPEVAGFDEADVTGVYELFDGQRTLGEVISASSPDLVVTLRIVDHLVGDGWLEQAEPEVEVPGPGIGEPKPDLARWIDPAGWSAAVVDGTAQDFRVVPPPEESPEDQVETAGELEADAEPETESDGGEEPAAETRDDGDERDDIETSAEKLERIAEASDVELEEPGESDGGASAATETGNSGSSAESDDDSDEGEAEGIASEFDSEPDEEEISSVLKTDSEPELTTDSQPMVDSEAADEEEAKPEPDDGDPSPNGEEEHDETTLEAEASGELVAESEEEADESPAEDEEASVEEADPHETLDLDSVPEREEVQPEGSDSSEPDLPAAEASSEVEAAQEERVSSDDGDERAKDGERSWETPDIDPVTLLDEADPGREQSGRDEELEGPGPQLHDRHRPGTMERVELSLDRRGRGATQTDYSERDEEPPSERVEPKVPVSDDEAPEQVAEAQEHEELETVELEEEVEGDDRLGPTEETPVTGLDAASPEEGSEYAARKEESTAEAGGTAGDQTAPEEISTDELPRATRGTVEGGDSGDSTNSSGLLLSALVLVVLVAAVGYIVSDDLSSGDDGTTETASAESRETTGSSPAEEEAARSGSDKDEGAKPSDETETMAQGSAAGMEKSDPGEPSLQIVEETRRQGRDIAGGVSETASNLPVGAMAAAEQTDSDANDSSQSSGDESAETASDEPGESEPQENSDAPDESTEKTSANPGESSDDGAEAAESEEEESSEKPVEAEPDDTPEEQGGSEVAEKSSGSEEAAGDDQTARDDQESSDSSDAGNIEAIAGLIDRQEYTAAEQKLDTLPGRLQQDAKVRDLYLDLAAGYQTEAGDVAAAKRVYQEYLDLFPDGKYASDVRSILSRLEGE